MRQFRPERAVTAMVRVVLDPFRLMTVLPLRLTRHGAVAVARLSRRWERLLEQALTDPVLPRGWIGAVEPPAASEEAHGPRPADGHDSSEHRNVVIDLTDDEMAEWAQMPYAAASVRARELPVGDLRALLDYEQEHGHRPRFVQLLRHRLDVLGTTRGAG